MTYIVVGLGNPGEEYVGTRHNVGKDFVDSIDSIVNIKPYASTEFMNHSGKFVAKLVKSKKSAEKLVVIHDDLDLPFGTFKMSFNKGPGGHRGVASIIKAIKSEAFIRIRIGVSPTTPSGKLKKPIGEDKVIKFILGKFSPNEAKSIKNLSKKIREALNVLSKEGKDKAMSLQY